MAKKIGIVGFGNMGSAIAEQLKIDTDYKIIVFDKDAAKLNNLSGIEAAKSISGLISECDVVILAIKPQDFDIVLNEIKACKHLTDKLFISIATGVTTSYIETILGIVRVVRAMPNLPAKVGDALTCLAKGKFASDQDFEFADEIFGFVGQVMEIGELMMNAATAISGSGPGFLCDLIEDKAPEEIKNFAESIFMPALETSAKNQGFNSEQAKIMAKITTEGTLQYLKKENLSPGEVKKLVASKGGTTEAGLTVLKHNIDNLPEAVSIAAKRAKELSKE